MLPSGRISSQICSRALRSPAAREDKDKECTFPRYIESKRNQAEWLGWLTLAKVHLR